MGLKVWTTVLTLAHEKEGIVYRGSRRPEPQEGYPYWDRLTGADT